MWTGIVAVAVFLVVIYTLLYLISRFRWYGIRRVAWPGEEEVDLLSGSGLPLIIAHRGGAGLGPENTLSACQKSCQLGVDMLELDVRLTADGKLVTHHDATIDRMSDGCGPVAEKTADELRKYDFSTGFFDEEREEEEKIALLDEIMAEFKGARFTLEIKDEGYRGKEAVDELMDLLSRHDNRQNVIVGSFHDEVLDYLSRNYPGQVAYSASQLEVGKFVILNLLRLGGLYGGDISALQLPTSFRGINLVRKRLIKAAHSMDIAVHYWTVNSPEKMERLIELGVDGIITDRPDILIELLEN